jgi:hypothetical protein
MNSEKFQRLKPKDQWKDTKNYYPGGQGHGPLMTNSHKSFQQAYDSQRTGPVVNLAAAVISEPNVDLLIAREVPRDHKIAGSNNGTWAAGMGRGALFPPSMNGPLGYINYPLPYDQEMPVLFDGPKYNAQAYNGPAYNEAAFKSVSGYTFNKYSTDQAPIGESASILVLKPNMS